MVKRSRAHELLFFTMAALALASPAAGAISLRHVKSASLPEAMVIRDVRWAGASEVYVSEGKRGVVRIPIDSPSHGTSVLPGGDRGGFPVSGMIAVGQKDLLVAAHLGVVGWIPLDGTAQKIRYKTLLTVMDIDAHGDTAAVLGADRGDLLGLARDGTIAWIGSLSKGLSQMRPLMKGRSEPGGKDMARCGILETGAIRFMTDGSLVVVPGAEPGIYRYSAAGRLMQTWDTEPFGIVDNCSIDDEELHLLARDFARRNEWFASRIILDDILPFASGPGLLLRRVENGVTKWDLVVLPYGKGKPERIPVPLVMPTPRAHVRGDVRGNRIVLLAFDDPLPGQNPVGPPRLVVFSFAP
jgi:hypothetical protein